MENLIFDRTQLDITNKTEKGRYNYTDFNRIESWCEYIANTLNSYSYSISILTKTNYSLKNKPNESDLERIRNNINTLKQAYFSFTEIPENLEYMTFEKANDIERILYEIEKLLSYMENNFDYCGVGGCGQSRLSQRRFRQTQLCHNEISTDGVLENSMGKDLINYKIYGNTGGVGNKTHNLYYENNSDVSALGVTVTYDEATQVYTLNGTTNNVQNINISINMDIPLEDNEEIVVSRHKVGGSVTFPNSSAYLFYGLFNQENSAYTQNRIAERADTVDSEILSVQTNLPKRGSSSLYRMYIQCLGSSRIVFDNFQIKLQITKGTELLEFELHNKYKIPVVVNSANASGTNTPYKSKSTNIYLDEPLELEEYIEFQNSGEFPPIQTYNGKTIIVIDTEVQPSVVEYEYSKRGRL